MKVLLLRVSGRDGDSPLRVAAAATNLLELKVSNGIAEITKAD